MIKELIRIKVKSLRIAIFQNIIRVIMRQILGRLLVSRDIVELSSIWKALYILQLFDPND